MPDVIYPTLPILLDYSASDCLGRYFAIQLPLFPVLLAI